VVGGGLLERLARCRDEFEVRTVLVRDPAKVRGLDLELPGVTSDIDAFLATDADVVVDVLSSAEAGARICEHALGRGVHVVSANKQAVVRGHVALCAAAELSGARLLYSAAVGGGAPLIETVRLARRHGPVAAVEGVLNGTVNYVLDLLTSGASFEGALHGARAAGLAEEDASADLDGLDAAAKLQILAWEAFGGRLELGDIDRDSLSPDPDAAADWSRIKQVSRVELTPAGLSASVRLIEAPDHLGLRSEGNVLRVTGADGTFWSGRGRGAGRWPTTESVFADLVDLRAMMAP
jgi:homoserine dehydrogenase